VNKESLEKFGKFCEKYEYLLNFNGCKELAQK